MMIAPLHVTHEDTLGGAGRAAYRLHQGMRQAGIASRMLVRHRRSNDPSVQSLPTPLRLLDYLTAQLDQRAPRLYRGRRPQLQWGVGMLPNLNGVYARQLRPSLFHLHWVSAGMLALSSLSALGRPVIWSLHDMWPLTGGCHYDQACGRFTQGCGACPQLGSHRRHDLSSLTYAQKAHHYRRTNLTVVALSSWMADLARRSPLLAEARIVQIPNGLDLTCYRPRQRLAARDLLGLPPEQPVILFGAMLSQDARRKGVHLLAEALQRLRAFLPPEVQPMLVTFGGHSASQEQTAGFPLHALGVLQDDLTLALLYAAADLFVAPSLQDNLPNTVMEAAACGIPCVAFRLGGLPDLVLHQQTGYLAELLDATDLAQGMVWLLTDPERRATVGRAARAHIEANFELGMVVQRYQSLYHEVVGQ
ncbi:MAG: glycosyltransferase [Oscillochloridaceae bacterium umkhey_bin13]